MMDFERNRTQLILNTLDCLYSALSYYQGQDKSELTIVLVDARSTVQALVAEANKQENSIYPQLDRFLELSIEVRKQIYKVATFISNHYIAFTDMLHTAKIPIEYLFAGFDSDSKQLMNIH